MYNMCKSPMLCIKYSEVFEKKQIDIRHSQNQLEVQAFTYVKTNIGNYSLFFAFKKKKIFIFIIIMYIILFSTYTNYKDNQKGWLV